MLSCYLWVEFSSNNKTLNARLLARPRHKFVTGATLLQLGRICQNRGSNKDISMGKLHIIFNIDKY